jgi:hypothetical protein
VRFTLNLVSRLPFEPASRCVRSFAVAAWAALIFCPAAGAATITLDGLITQSTQDGTGPAVNNPTLNNIGDGDAYTILLTFPGSISSPGAFNPLAGAAITFTDGVVATESSFSSVFLTVSVDSNPALYDVSLLACLSTGSGCGMGNSLSADFAVTAASFNSLNAPAQLIPGLFPPLDLLEDDGVTDIQGTITSFSNSSAAASVPEPSAMLCNCAVLALLAFASRLAKKETRS